MMRQSWAWQQTVTYEPQLKVIESRDYPVDLGVASVEAELVMVPVLIDLLPVKKDRSLCDLHSPYPLTAIINGTQDTFRAILFCACLGNV